MANDRWRTRLRLLYKLPVNNLNDLSRKVVAIMALVSENKPLRWESGEHVVGNVHEDPELLEAHNEIH